MYIPNCHDLNGLIQILFNPLFEFYIKFLKILIKLLLILTISFP